MSRILLLELIASIRDRLDDYGGDRGPPSVGYYAKWQEDDTPCLWKNQELIRYLKRAIRDVADRCPWDTEPVASSKYPSPIEVTVEPLSTDLIYLPDSFLEVESITPASTGRPLVKAESSRMIAIGGVGWETDIGRPTHYLEPQRGTIRIYPIPAIADTMRLRVKHRTSDDFEWEDIATESRPLFELCDIPVDLEEALIVSTCRLAYSKRDAETYDVSAARECERLLVDLIGPPTSWRQKEARRHNANLDIDIHAFPYNARRGIGRWWRAGRC